MATPPPGPGGRPSTAHRRSDGALGRVHDRVAAAGLVRPSRGRLLAGVLAGVANRLGVSAFLVRAVFLLSMLLPGPQFVLYAILWIAMPREP